MQNLIFYKNVEQFLPTIMVKLISRFSYIIELLKLVHDKRRIMVHLLLTSNLDEFLHLDEIL
jgi:hypothetical protein